MKVLVACEEWGLVRDELIERGQDAGHQLRDLLPSARRSAPTIKAMLLSIIDQGTGHDDCLPALHSPCRVQSARWWKGKEREQIEALWFVFALLNAPIPRIAVENPIGKLSTAFRKPDQIHPSLGSSDTGRQSRRAYC